MRNNFCTQTPHFVNCGHLPEQLSSFPVTDPGAPYYDKPELGAEQN